MKTENIGSILTRFKIAPKKVCKYEWQDKAFTVADKLGIKFTKETRALLPRWMSLFKSGSISKIERCYSFVVDYNKPLNSDGKIRLFFWKYGQMKQTP